MTTVRRRVLRPVRAAPATNARQEARLQKKRAQLDRERATMQRWMTKLRRAFRAVEKQQQRIARLERQLVQH